MKTINDCKVGDTVYVQKEYELCRATFLKLNKKSVKVRYERQDYQGNISFEEKNEKIEKVAHAEELIAVVWERWKGVNGRGGYRLDKTMYPSYHMKAQEWPYQAYLWEDALGEVSKDNIDAKIQNQKNLEKIVKAFKL